MAHTLLDKLSTYYIELMDAFLSVVGPYIQMVERADDVPPENVIALYKSAEKWGTYPLNDELYKLREHIPPIIFLTVIIIYYSIVI